MSIRKLDTVVVRRYLDSTLLLSAPGLCLLDIGVVRAEIPRELEVNGATSAVRNRQHKVQRSDVHVPWLSPIARRSNTTAIASSPSGTTINIW